MGYEIEMNLKKEEQGKSDLVKAIKFQKNYTDFHLKLQNISKEYIYFWKDFTQDLPGSKYIIYIDYNKILIKGGKLADEGGILENMFQNIIADYSQAIKAYVSYSLFLQNVSADLTRAGGIIMA